MLWQTIQKSKQKDFEYGLYIEYDSPPTLEDLSDEEEYKEFIKYSEDGHMGVEYAERYILKLIYQKFETTGITLEDFLDLFN